MDLKEGSKYYPLYKFLEQSREDEVVLTFTAVESLLQSALPPSARRQRGWWSNRESSRALQAAAWRSAGYEMSELNLEEGRVVFRRRPFSYRVVYQGDAPVWDAGLIRALRQYMNLTQAEMADELGVRQQTISEWETDVYAPSRATAKYLTLIAERAGFLYSARPGDDHPPDQGN
jgi:DNA-binding XRE family transcriptional regulator